MPFTPAHAAAALPFLRVLVPSAIVVGTMAPDFEYFLRFAPGGGFGHTVPGAFLLSLPLALLVLWTFHALLKAPLVELFPAGIRLRIQAQAVPFRFGGPGRFALIVVSALVGIATHLVWDSFTHRDMWPSRHFPWLTRGMPLPILGWTPHFAVLQLASSAAGILILLAWLAHWYCTTAPIRAEMESGMSALGRYLVLGGVCLIAPVGGIVRAAMTLAAPGHNWVTIIGDGTATSIALAWWMLVFYAVISARRWSRREI